MKGSCSARILSTRAWSMRWKTALVLLLVAHDLGEREGRGREVEGAEGEEALDPGVGLHEVDGDEHREERGAEGDRGLGGEGGGVLGGGVGLGGHGRSLLSHGTHRTCRTTRSLLSTPAQPPRYVRAMPDHTPPSSEHMSPEEFRRHGHAAIDWIADYWASLDDLPVRAQVAPGDVRRQLPALGTGDRRAVRRRARGPRPRRGAGPDALAAPALLRLLPGQLLAGRHPRRPHLQRHRRAGDDLGDQPGGHARSSRWCSTGSPRRSGCRTAFRSDGPGGGVIQDTASTATFTALLAALHRASGGEARVAASATSRGGSTAPRRRTRRW